MIIGVLWKREVAIALRILLFLIWWCVVAIRWNCLWFLSTIILFFFSPRIFEECMNVVMTHFFWFVNTIYPTHCLTSTCKWRKGYAKYNSHDNPTVSIIVCNKDKSSKILEKSITSIVLSIKYAESKLGIGYIRMVFADGGSNNIEAICNRYSEIFDLIEIIPGGKLSQRHVATLNEASDIIIAYDSDREYAIANAFLHLDAFVKNGYGKIKGEITKVPVVGTTYYLHHHGTVSFKGGNSAYIRQVYLK